MGVGAQLLLPISMGEGIGSACPGVTAGECGTGVLLIQCLHEGTLAQHRRKEIRGSDSYSWKGSRCHLEEETATLVLGPWSGENPNERSENRCWVGWDDCWVPGRRAGVQHAGRWGGRAIA